MRGDGEPAKTRVVGLMMSMSVMVLVAVVLVASVPAPSSQRAKKIKLPLRREEELFKLESGGFLRGGGGGPGGGLSHRLLEEDTTTNTTSAEGEDDTDRHESENDSEGRPYDAVVYIGFGCFLGAVTLWGIDRFALSVPFTVVVFAEGLLLAGINHATSESLGVLSRSIRLWEVIDPELLLNSFLPILIFGDATDLNVHLFRQKLWQCVVLAGPGIVIGAFAMGGFVYGCTPYDWTFFLCCTYGAITAATDPVAVVALLQTLGASPGVTMVITGESLFNDGTAMVMFWLFLSLAQGHKKYSSAWAVVRFFLQMAVAGPFMGIAFGTMALICLHASSRKFVEVDTTLQITITIATAYLSYFVADVVASSSGVLSCVFAGVTLAKYAGEVIQAPETMRSIWTSFGFLANTMIFLLAGTITGQIMCDNWYTTGGKGWFGPYDVAVVVVVWLAGIAIRAGMLALCWPAVAYLERATPAGKRLGLHEYLFMAWSAPRGAVGLALALVADEKFRIEDEPKSAWSKRGQQILVLTSGTAFLTLLINSWSSRALLSYLEMNETDASTKHLRAFFELRTARALEDRLDTLRTDVDIDDGVVQGHVSLLYRLADVLSPKGEEFQNVPHVVTPPRRSTSPLSPLEVDGEEKANIHAPVQQQQQQQQELLKSMREIYLRVLKAEYLELIATGFVPPGSHGALILLTSVDVARDHTAEKLLDYQYIEKQLRTITSKRSVPAIQDIPALVDHAFRRLQSWLPGRKKPRNHFSELSIFQTEMLYVQLSFIKAHTSVLRETSDLWQHLADHEHVASLPQIIADEVEAELAEARALLAQAPRSARRDLNSKIIAQALLTYEHEIYGDLLKHGLVSASDHSFLLQDLIKDEVSLASDVRRSGIPVWWRPGRSLPPEEFVRP